MGGVIWERTKTKIKPNQPVHLHKPSFLFSKFLMIHKIVSVKNEDNDQTAQICSLTRVIFYVNKQRSTINKLTEKEWSISGRA